MPALARCLAEPLIVPQVLHTGRGGGQQGRYQSPALSLQGVTGFIHEFNTYLSSAGRFDRWKHSPGLQARCSGTATTCSTPMAR